MYQKIDLKNYPISSQLNVAILIFSSSLSITCLYAAEKSTHLLFTLLWAILFSFSNNTLFSLLHEAVHGVMHSDRKWNIWLGRISALFFPTSFTLQQIYHLGHHRRNRTDDEMFDLYYEGDKIWLKKLTIFGIMSGIYWSTAFLSCMIFLFFPYFYQSEKFINSKFNKAFNFDAMVESVAKRKTPITTIRLESLAALCFHLFLIFVLGISFKVWLLCYWFFGINWGSLQYTDHAFTSRNIREGAWNLKAHPIVRWFFLNYHFHQIHHRYPNLPWIHLPKLVIPGDPMPSFFEIYFRLWRGPEKATESCPTIDKGFEEIIFERTPYEASPSHFK